MSETNQKQLIQPKELEPITVLLEKVLGELDRVLLGRKELHRMVVIAVMSQGHVLLEGLPGLGKTALVKALGQVLGLDFNRAQFTPDLMPGDILGSHILEENSSGGRDMVFRPGPIFTNILLADEINRASPKTQSALLEAMQEHSVTLLGQTRKLPEPFFVLASQNPIELEGTYPLPEAQLDRFQFKLHVTGLATGVLEDIIISRRRGEPPQIEWTMSAGELDAVFAVMNNVLLPRGVGRYIARLVAATHPDGEEAPAMVKDYVNYGGSPRAAIAIAEAARGHALLSGRPSVGFEDVKAVTAAALNHRILLNYKARIDQVTSDAVIASILDRLKAGDASLPAGVTLEDRS